MYVIKDQLDYFEEKFAKIIQIFLSKKVTSGSDTIIPKAYPDPQNCHRLQSKDKHTEPRTGKIGILCGTTGFCLVLRKEPKFQKP